MKTTVLFADISGNTDGYQQACVEQLCALAQSAGGRVVKVHGDEVIALFPSSGDAERAAEAMHAAIDEVAGAQGAKLAVQLGLYSGDTVKLAARLLEEAQRGERPAAHDDMTTTLIAQRIAPLPDIAASYASVALRLMYRQRLVCYLREGESAIIGRHHSCEIAVADRMASRRHCTIEWRDGDFVLRDHSSNGTWIYTDGEKGALLKGEPIVLRSRGWIGFGPARFADSDFVEFFCA